MVHTSALTAAAAALLLALPCSAGLYSKNSPVLQVDGKSYDRLIARSNHTSLVEFYAPWCGHCKNLQPAFEKAAKNLAGLVKLAAVDCDEEANKQFCGSMGINGFPTLKIVKPGKKPGSPFVEDYNGPREAKGIVDTMIGKIPNHVKKVTDKDLDTFLSENNNTAKAIIFTEKGTTSALLKAVSVDFLGSITVAQIRSREASAVETFGITKFPSIALLPGGETPAILYNGEIKKEGIVAFFAQVAAPNPDPAPLKTKTHKEKKLKASDKAAKSSFSSASSSHQASEASSGAASATEETIIDEPAPTESPSPDDDSTEKPVVLPEVAPPIVTLTTTEELVRACLEPKSGTCVLVFVPSSSDGPATKALDSLAEIAHKHAQAKRHIFPFYAVPDDNAEAVPLKKSLGLSGDVELIALNRKRGWYKVYENKNDLNLEGVETWIDRIRMGEGVKQKLPGVIMAEKTVNEAVEHQIPLETHADKDSVVAEESAEPEPTVSKKDEL